MTPESVRSHLQFNLMPQQKGRVTQQWEVTSPDSGIVLGMVAWYSHWRRYCFWPLKGTLHDARCLQELSNFCRDQTMLHKQEHDTAPKHYDGHIRTATDQESKINYECAPF